MQKAVDKIEAEMSTVSNKYVTQIGSFLLDYIKKHPEQASHFHDDDKSIMKSIAVMETEARKNLIDNRIGMLSDEEGYQIVLNYFGVTEERIQGFGIDLDSLLN